MIDNQQKKKYKEQLKNDADSIVVTRYWSGDQVLPLEKIRDYKRNRILKVF